MKNVITRLRVWARDYEPARTSAVVYAVLAVAGTLGYGQIVAGLEPVTNGVLGLIAAVALWLAGGSTRKRVWSQHTLDGDPDVAGQVSESLEGSDNDVELLTDEEADELDDLEPEESEESEESDSV